MRWVVLLACTGCGRIGFDAGGRPGTDAAIEPDAAATCITAFDGDALPAGMETYGSGTVEVTNGRVRIAIQGNVNSSAGIVATVGASHVGKSTAIQMVSPSSIPSASTTLGWHPPGTLSVHLEMDGTNLKLHSLDSMIGDYQEYRSARYDPVEHAWWRLRDDAGTVVAEVSRDGVEWNAFTTLPIALDLTEIKWDLGLGAFVVGIAPAESSFDNLVDCTQ